MARQFGASWWGKAWLDALEGRALVNPNRLPRGRTYARQARVVHPELGPGRISATVLGTEPYSTSLYLRVLAEAEWDLVVDTIMSEAGNIAALLAGELPHSIGDLLLPAAGELGPTCSCPDRADPCKHAAALCYIAADLFDQDPFSLVALRGHDRNQLLAQVRERRAAHLGTSVAAPSELPRGPDPGVNATAAWKRQQGPGDSSAVVPIRPARPAPLSIAPPGDAGIDPTELAELVGDAAQRAWSMLADGTPSGLGLTPGADVVRRATQANPDKVAAISAATSIDESELLAAVHAWRTGGEAGYRAARQSADVHGPDRSTMESAAQVLADAVQVGLDQIRIRGAHVSTTAAQLRLDPDGDWWLFDHDQTFGWLLTEGPAQDPGDLLFTRPD